MNLNLTHEQVAPISFLRIQMSAKTSSIRLLTPYRTIAAAVGNSLTASPVLRSATTRSNCD